MKKILQPKTIALTTPLQSHLSPKKAICCQRRSSKNREKPVLQLKP